MRINRISAVFAATLLAGTLSAQSRQLGVFTSTQSVPSTVEANAAAATGPYGQLWLEPGSGYSGAALFATGQPLILGNGGYEAMRVFTDGHISIGAPYNLARFSTLEYALGGASAYFVHQTRVQSNINQVEYGLYAVERQDIDAGMTNSGDVTGAQFEGWNFGPGTSGRLFGARYLVGNYVGTSGTVTEAFGAHIQVQSGSGTITNGYGLYVADVAATNAYGIYQVGANDKNFFAGDTFFQGAVTGNNISATYQDIAEWVPANQDLAPGTVVVLDPAIGNGVKPSSSAYDTTVAGVVSAKPGITLGKGGEGQEKIATTGRVKVFVDATAAPIQVGDLLVTSSVPGTAMKSMPVEVGGIAIHRPGTIIGKALEPLAGGKGEILVLLSMQ